MKQSNLFTSIKAKKEIDYLFDYGKNFNTPLFYTRYLFLSKNNYKTNSQWAVPIGIVWAVPKKTGKAHYRNKIKRIARSVFFEILKQLQQKKIKVSSQKLNLAFIPKVFFERVSFPSKIQAVEKFLSDISFIK